MKKNILTIIIMAISLINTALIAVLIFSIVPAANRTTSFVNKVAAIVDLELESPNPEEQVSINDIETYPFAEPIETSLASSDGTDHYVSVEVTLSMNTKNEDYEKYSEKVEPNEKALREIIEDTFSQYTKDQVKPNKEVIKQQIRSKIQEYFDSDFITNVTLSNLLIE